MKTRIKPIIAAAVFLFAALSLNAEDLKFLGISLGQDARTVQQQLVRKGYELRQEKSRLTRLDGKLNGYPVSAEISFDDDGSIHNLLVRTSRASASTNAGDLKSFINWATEQYGAPARTTATAPDAYTDEYAEWKMPDGKNIVVKSTSDAYVTLIFYQDHKQRHMSLSDLIKGSARRKGQDMTNEEARLAQRDTEAEIGEKANEVLREQEQAQNQTARKQSPNKAKSGRSLLDILRSLFGK